MTMIDETETQAAESQAPEAPRRFSLAEALASPIGEQAPDDDQPEETHEPAARSEPKPETPPAAEKAPEGEAPSTQSVDYATLRAPELRQHLTEREKELQAVRDEAAKLKTELDDHRQYRVTMGDHELAAREVFGSDDDYQRLARKVQAAKDLEQDPSYYLTAEEMETLDRLTAQRLHGAKLFALANERINERQWEAIENRIEKHGLDPKTVTKNIDRGALIDHVVSVTEKRLNEQHKDALAEWEAKYDDLNRKFQARRADPGVGGRSGPADSQARDGFDPQRSPHENLREAFARPANGRS